MSELDSLIRIRRHAIEDKQKALAVLYKQAQDLKDERDALETQLAIEAEKTKEMELGLLGYFEPYSKKTRAQIEAIDNARMQLEGRIEFAQDEMRDAFADMKKIEIIDERRKAEFQAELEKKEAQILDEIALNPFR